jgi:hypothetical protein
MRIMLAGDTHGGIGHIEHKINMARANGIQRIVVLGDFGLWWGHGAIRFLDEVNDLAKNVDVQIFALPGNHENYEWWESLVLNSPAKSKGWAYVRSNVLLSPRVHDFVWGGKQFLIAGGAVSIDKKMRLENEKYSGRKTYSPREQLTDTEVDSILASRFANGIGVDYFLTHDCSNMTPFSHSLVPDFDSQIHRQRIDTILRAVKPKNHFHGHMHHRYEWMNRVGGGEWTQTYGLDCDNNDWSWGILDLSKDEFVWGGKRNLI